MRDEQKHTPQDVCGEATSGVVRASAWMSNQERMIRILVKRILGDPGADSGDEEKSKRAEKKWHEEK